MTDKQLKDEIVIEARKLEGDTDMDVGYNHNQIVFAIDKAFKAGQDTQRKKDLEEIDKFRTEVIGGYFFEGEQEILKTLEILKKKLEDKNE